MDKITQRLFGIAAIIFAFAFLIRTASPAQADNAPETTYSTGRYMMTFESAVTTDDTYWYILVWDTETGRSKLYYGTTEAGMNEAPSEYQLPSSPL